MEIRLATRSDLDSLVEFNQAMALETESKHLDPTTLRSGVAAVFETDDKGFYVVAETGGDIVGGLLVTYEWSDWRNGWFWWIQSVYIRNEHRGKSIYSRLYEFVKHLARDRDNVCGFRLYVEKENLHAQRVYEKLGMTETYYLLYEEEEEKRKPGHL
jgi:ribosomal protein S18 acetylase RimI-like enzyme